MTDTRESIIEELQISEIYNNDIASDLFNRIAIVVINEQKLKQVAAEKHICDYPTCSVRGSGHPLACGCRSE